MRFTATSALNLGTPARVGFLAIQIVVSSAMPTASERLTGVRAKIERARHHVSDLESRLLAFRALRPYRLYSEPEAGTGHHVYKVRAHANPPAELAVVAGEIVHQLRSGLDHLAWQLWDKNGRAGLPEEQIYFPVYESEPKHLAKRSAKVLTVFEPAAVSVLDAVQPHASGSDLLWKLHKLNNIDKHRHLSVVACTVGSMGFALGPDVHDPAAKAFLLNVPKPVAPDGGLRVIEDGAVLCAIDSFRHPSGGPTGLEGRLDVKFDLVFKDPEVVRGAPILRLLRQLADLTDGIVGRFEPLL